MIGASRSKKVGGALEGEALGRALELGVKLGVRDITSSDTGCAVDREREDCIC
jgi:hypothetical protein